jgi:hypothetical protein
LILVQRRDLFHKESLLIRSIEQGLVQYRFRLQSIHAPAARTATQQGPCVEINNRLERSQSLCGWRMQNISQFAARSGRICGAAAFQLRILTGVEHGMKPLALSAQHKGCRAIRAGYL